MENIASIDIKATLLIKPTELDFVVHLLQALKIRGLIEFKLENEPEFEPGFRQITAKQLNEIIERSENSRDISLEEFKVKHQL